MAKSTIIKGIYDWMTGDRKAPPVKIGLNPNHPTSKAIIERNKEYKRQIEDDPYAPPLKKK